MTPGVVRIGVTGIRAVSGCPEAAPPALTASLRAVLDTAVARLAVAGRPAMLRCLSPLAEGADQLFARVALDRREAARDQGVAISLEIPIPFSQPEYLANFETGRADDPVASFHALTEAAGNGVMELDGGTGDGETLVSSYEAIGRMVVRNVDLLIAVWDPQLPPRGRGGTRDTVAFALACGTPVWCIDPAGRLADRFLEPGGAEHEVPAARLARYLEGLPNHSVSDPSMPDEGLARAAVLLAAMGWTLALPGGDEPLPAARSMPLVPGSIAVRLGELHAEMLALLAEWGDAAAEPVRRIDPHRALASVALGEYFRAAALRRAGRS
ncbi:hypothetical protein [Novosphingobium colocasiae]|uniref:Uncharacterized protein n=1 Tax=Novosphingobium colocasiae TaxID=1256513 RepID=A0A918P8E9_9SPHN|nr:hypothetical protein [Novosphingobium colocasiae]GGY90475.1 hypothetical protein GCM10011614_01440 [Novosphingobium colocasiae]